ncbi:hypothetical protein J6590_046391 [Homalodisca vitripennis]|nr:hypothetical protein J6590_046391 [Homalodisca vitripennis]
MVERCADAGLSDISASQSAAPGARAQHLPTLAKLSKDQYASRENLCEPTVQISSSYERNAVKKNRDGRRKALGGMWDRGQTREDSVPENTRGPA